jgi:hypothetical protein
MIPRAMLAVAYATAKVSHARQVMGDDQDKKGYPGPPGWGLNVRLTTPPRIKVLLGNLNWRPRSTQDCRADDDDEDARRVVLYKEATTIFRNLRNCLPNDVV